MAEVLHGIVDGGVRMRAGDDANGRNRIPVASRGIISTNREFYAYHTPTNSTVIGILCWMSKQFKKDGHVLTQRYA